jgi:hypothetical protein
LRGIAETPEGRTATIRALAAILEEPEVDYWTGSAAIALLGELRSVEAVPQMVKRLDWTSGHPDGLAGYPDGKYDVADALARIGGPALAELTAVLSNGSVAERRLAAHALGSMEEQGEQALRRARPVEKDAGVLEIIDQAIDQIEYGRPYSADPAVVARHCVPGDSPGEAPYEFTARPIGSLFLDGATTRVDLTLCHVGGQYRKTGGGEWWLLRKTSSGVETTRIGANPFFYGVGEFIPSSDGRYLAVLSFAEGAPLRASEPSTTTSSPCLSDVLDHPARFKKFGLASSKFQLTT